MKNFRVIRSGKHTYAFHEVDLDKYTRLIVQDSRRGWLGYKWIDPPQGSIAIINDNLMSEEQALAWLKEQL